MVSELPLIANVIPKTMKTTNGSSQLLARTGMTRNFISILGKAIQNIRYPISDLDPT